MEQDYIFTKPEELTTVLITLAPESYQNTDDLTYVLHQACAEIGRSHDFTKLPERHIIQEIIAQGLSVIKPDEIYGPLPYDPIDADEITDRTAWYVLMERRYFYCAVVALTAINFCPDERFTYWSRTRQVFLRVDCKHILSEEALACKSIFGENRERKLHTVSPIYGPVPDEAQPKYERRYWNIFQGKYCRDYLEYSWGSADDAATYYWRREEVIK